MSVDVAVLRPATIAAKLRQASRRIDGYRACIWAIVLAQAVWFGVLCGLGWYYQADFSNLAEASGHRLSWSYLTLSQGGHLGVFGRLMFWLLNRIAPLNYPLTIVIRLLAQAVTTVLLGRLLTILGGRRRGVLVVLGLYAMSPLLVPGTLWLTSAIGLLGSQVFLLIALTSHVRYALTRQLRWAIVTAGGIFGATVVAEQAAVTALILPLLSLGFLHAGTLRQRIRSTLSCWPEWVMIAAPILAFLGYFFLAGDYGTAAHGVSLPDALKVVGVEWSASIAPSLMGGPWTWYASGNNFISVAEPTWALRIVCIAAISCVIALGVRRTAWRALVAWAMPAAVSGIGVVVVALGRFQDFGLLIGKQTEHAYFTAIPAAIAICLSLWATTPDEIRARLDISRPPGGASRAQHGHAGSRIRHLGTGLSVAIVVAGSAMSAASYVHRWAESPARGYVDNLANSLRAAGPNVYLYDTAVNPVIVPILEPANQVSDLVGLTGRPARFVGGTGASRVVASSGRIVPAMFVADARVDSSGSNKFCNNLITQRHDRVEALTPHPHRNEWFLRLNYFQQHASVLYVTLVDRSGQEFSPATGSRVVLSSQLGTTYLRFPFAEPVAVRIRGGAQSTNVCLTQVQIGYPLPVTPK